MAATESPKTANQTNAPEGKAGDAKAPPPRDVRLMPERMKLREMAIQDWAVTAAAGTQIEDVLKPEYWSHNAGRFQPGDHIEVRIDTEEWLLELLVLETARSFIRVFLLKHHELGDWRDAELKGQLHKVEFKGTHLKWSVIRTSDGAVIKDQFANAYVASAFMVQHEKTVGK